MRSAKLTEVYHRIKREAAAAKSPRRAQATRLGIERLSAREMLTTLVISEIQYDPHPAIAALGEADVSATNFEFIEVTNSGPESINLRGIRLTQTIIDGSPEGVDFVFSEGTLEPGERAVVVRNLEAFPTRYGRQVNVAGEWSSGSLSNQGETLTLLDANDIIIQQFAYDNDSDWPLRAEGRGASLELIDLNADPSDPASWRSSREVGGSPGQNSIAAQTDRVLINEVLSHTDPPQYDSIELHNVTDRAIDLSGWYLSDRIDDPIRFAIPDGTQIPAGGYYVVDEQQFNPGGGDLPDDFAISEYGEEVYLFSPRPNGRPRLIEDMVIVGYTDNGQSVGNVNDVRDGRELLRLINLTLGGSNSAHDPSPLVVSEVYFHPPDDDVYLEYIEVMNVSSQVVDAANWELTDAVEFVFPSSLSVATSDSVVVVGFDPQNVDLAERFREHFEIDSSVVLLGPWSSNRSGEPDRLSDSGEMIALRRPLWENGEIYFALSEFVDYRDDDPWPEAADGHGASLRRRELTGYANDAASWEAARPSPGNQPLRLDNLPELTLDTVQTETLGADALHQRGTVDVDVFRFTPSALGEFHFRAEGAIGNPAVPWLRLFADDGRELGRSRPESGSAVAEITQQLAADTLYYVAVSGDPGNDIPEESLFDVGSIPGSLGDYTIGVSLASNGVDRHNRRLPVDVDGDGTVTPFDALLVINELNGRAAVGTGGELQGSGPPYWDVNHDGTVSPIDALAVINRLNADRRTQAAVSPTRLWSQPVNQPRNFADSTRAAAVAAYLDDLQRQVDGRASFGPLKSLAVNGGEGQPAAHSQRQTRQ